MRKRHLILDAQYGSTGKGLYAGFLAQHIQCDTIAYAPSPNAGHTLVWDGRTFIHKMLPSGITSPMLQQIVLGPGSLIDLDRLAGELGDLYERLPEFRNVRIYVHRNAACVYDRHREAESQGGTAPGSTRQGVGAAQIERIRRNPEQLNAIFQADHPVLRFIMLVDTPRMQQIYADSASLLIESCQGFSLSMYHGQYPYTTCRDVTASSIMSDTGVPMMNGSPTVHGTFRTFPIRVANRPDAGEWSGPSYHDSAEITFESIGQQQELTTVTKLPRRIFTWSQQQAMEACYQSNIQVGFLNFAQYPIQYKHLVDIWERLNECTNVQYLGFGPSLADIYRVGAPAIEADRIKAIYQRYRGAAG